MALERMGSSRLGGMRGRLSSWRRTLARAWQDWQWYVIALMWVTTFALGAAGFAAYFTATGQERSGWDVLYSALQLFVLESGGVSGPLNWQLETARFLAPVVAVFTVIQAVVSVFYEELLRTKARFFRDFFVVCGLGRKGLLITGELCRRGCRVVAIERDEKNPNIGPCREWGAVVIPWDGTDETTLRRAGVDRASYLISVCGDDGVNAEVVMRACALAGRRKGRTLNCVAHITEPELCAMVRECQLFRSREGDFRLEFFSVFDGGARALLADFPPFDVKSEGEREHRPHILVVGLGGFGKSVLFHAARMWHPVYRSSKKKLLVSVVDRAAEEKLESLCLRNPQLRQCCILEPLQMEVESPAFQRGDFVRRPGGEVTLTAVYVCFDDDSRGLYAALTLLRHLEGADIPVVVRVGRRAGLASLMGGDGEILQGYANLHAFPLLERTCRPEILLSGTSELLARAIHEEYVRNQAARGFTPLTNPSMVPWEELPEELKESNRRQADHIGAKLRAVGCDIRTLEDWDAEPLSFTPEEVELMARMEHQRWMEERRAEKWVYAPGPKDAERKTTPYLVPWEELPEEIREYDRETVRAIPAFLKEAGFQVYRLRGGGEAAGPGGDRGG